MEVHEDDSPAVVTWLEFYAIFQFLGFDSRHTVQRKANTFRRNRAAGCTRIWKWESFLKGRGRKLTGMPKSALPQNTLGKELSHFKAVVKRMAKAKGAEILHMYICYACMYMA